MKATRKHFLSKLPLTIQKDMEEDVEVVGSILKTKLPDELVHLVVEFAEPRGFVKLATTIWTERSITDMSVVNVRPWERDINGSTRYRCVYFVSPFSDIILGQLRSSDNPCSSYLHALQDTMCIERLYDYDQRTLLQEKRQIDYMTHGVHRRDIKRTNDGQTASKDLYWHGEFIGSRDSKRQKSRFLPWGSFGYNEHHVHGCYTFICDEKGTVQRFKIR